MPIGDYRIDGELTVVTLPYDPLVQGFPVERLSDYLHGRDLISYDAFAFNHKGRPTWSLGLHSRRRLGAPESRVMNTPGADRESGRHRKGEHAPRCSRRRATSLTGMPASTASCAIRCLTSTTGAVLPARLSIADAGVVRVARVACHRGPHRARVAVSANLAACPNRVERRPNLRSLVHDQAPLAVPSMAKATKSVGDPRVPRLRHAVTLGPVVSNSSPLIAFERIARIDLLLDTAGRPLLIP